MANSTRKCRYCKERGRADEMICVNGGWFHDLAAAARYGREGARKKAEKEHRERKAELKPISHWLAETQKVFNEFVRLRDHYDPCISCGALDSPEWCAGHFRTRGAASHLRFNENNVHKQCNKNCNLELSGNVIEYRKRLVSKIGEKAVVALENDSEPKKWTREELAEMRKHYRAKIKALKAQIEEQEAA